jgi:hypothetical protein
LAMVLRVASEMPSSSAVSLSDKCCSIDCFPTRGRMRFVFALIIEAGATLMARQRLRSSDTYKSVVPFSILASRFSEIPDRDATSSRERPAS